MASKGSNKPLAAIYGQALFEAARNAGVQEQVASELAGLKEMLAKAGRIGIFLETPTIAFEDKRKVIDAAFQKYTAITRNFLLVVAERGRTAMLSQIVDAYTDFANQTAGIATVEVRTARALDEGERAQVSKLMAEKLNKKINLAESVNPELIGGMVLLHGDKMWDGSLRYKLNEAIKRMEATRTDVVTWTE